MSGATTRSLPPSGLAALPVPRDEWSTGLVLGRSADALGTALSGGSPLVTLRQAAVSFGTVQALAEADLDVCRGEVIALVGANGSGKTTLLRVLHGVVAHRGLRTTGEPGLRQAMVFQRPFLLRLSVWNNLRIALWLAEPATPAPERHARAREALRRVGLEALAERPARALSGGEQQRLALARAWSSRPALLLLDEPTASLDPASKQSVEALLAGFAADGTTIVFSTHDPGQAARLATRVVHLEGGRIDADLPTAVFFDGARARADPFSGPFPRKAPPWLPQC